jgi:GNAT superfamily N-acetyltransferase
MSDDLMPVLRLPLTRELFRQLPRNAAYRYEYLDNEACLSPRPKHYHAVLDLEPLEEGAASLRPVAPSDFEELAALFADVFAHHQPFGSLTSEQLQATAHATLLRTRCGGDGPWIERASFVAVDGAEKRLLGACFITLLPQSDPTDAASYYWETAPPPNAIEQRLGNPHLTWIFVSPSLAGNNIGTALLAASVRELQMLGYTQLLSTFLLGNESSMLWHWRNGFRLLPHPVSYREMCNRRSDRGGQRSA